MNHQIGNKIRSLRKARNISQEVLAQYLGVSFQSVSKWENGSTLPDVTLIPAIASFFEVSTDELFDYNRMETERKVDIICHNAAQFRHSDPARAEQMLRDGLKQYPGNDIILNNLLYTMQVPERNLEVVDLCKALIESTRMDDVRYDALRILAQTYKAMGEYEMCKQTISKIPEIYFTKLQLDAMLLEGEDMFESAYEQMHQSAEMLLDMLLRLADYYEAKGEQDIMRRMLTMAKGVVEAMRCDEPNEILEKGFHDYYGKQVMEIVNKRMG